MNVTALKELPRTIPWTLYRSISREIVMVTLLSIVTLSLLFMIFAGVRAVQEGFTLRVIMPWIIESVGYSLFFTAPVSLLFASTLTYGRIAADREYTALCAAGVSPVQLFVPMAFVAGLSCAIAMATVGDVFPQFHYRQRNIASYLIKQLEHLGKGRKRTLPIEGGRVYYEECDGPRLRNLIVEKDIELTSGGIQGSNGTPQPATGDEDGEAKTVKAFFTAKWGEVSVRKEPERVVLTLDTVDFYIPDREGGLFEGEDWYEFIKLIPTTGQLEIEFPIHPKDKRTGDWSNDELREEWKKQEAIRDDARARAETLAGEDRVHAENLANYAQTRMDKAMAELWRRRALALSMFCFPLLGFPLSVTLRYRHRLVSFFFGISVVFLIFYPLLLLGNTLAENGALPAAFALLSGDAIIAGLAAYLLARLVN